MAVAPDAPVPRPPVALTRELIERAQREGPILAGQLWEGKGTGRHAAGTEVTVLRLSAGGKVQFARGRVSPTLRSRTGGRTYMLEEAAFRTQYRLLKQAPFSRKTAEAVVVAAAALFRAQGPDPEVIEREVRAMDVARQLAAEASAAPVAPGDPAGAPTDVTDVTDVAEPAAHEVLPEAAEDEAAAPEATPEAQAAQDPLEAFLAQGRATIELLEADVRRTEEDRELTRLELEELDTKLAQLRDRQTRVGRAISAALAAADPPGPPEPAPPAPARVTSLEDRAVLEDPKRRVRTGVGVAKRPAPPAHRTGQQAWFLGRLRALGDGGEFTGGDLAPDFRERFRFDTASEALDRVHVLVNNWMANPRSWPHVARVRRGVYRVMDEPQAPDSVVVVADAAAPAPAQREWLRARFAERKLWAVRDLVPLMMEAYGFERERARQNISSTIADWMKHPRERGVQIIRVSQGLYEAAE